MLVVDKQTNEVLGESCNLYDIKDVGTVHRFEPFVHKFGFIPYINGEEGFGIISQRHCILKEVEE